MVNGDRGLFHERRGENVNVRSSGSAVREFDMMWFRLSEGVVHTKTI